MRVVTRLSSRRNVKYSAPLPTPKRSLPLSRPGPRSQKFTTTTEGIFLYCNPHRLKEFTSWSQGAVMFLLLTCDLPNVTLTSSDLLPPGYRRPASADTDRKRPTPESIQPTANGSHHMPVSLACPLTLDLTHFTQSNHRCYTDIIITIIIIILSASADRA
ncbi:hypothetical protein Q8A73_004129 [Channa argus]|nr:hypothetical protein Q8A73_004129 [Channa argus]